MSKFKLACILIGLLLLINPAYAQDYSMVSGNFYELKQGQEKFEFRSFNETYRMCEFDERAIPILFANKDANNEDMYSLDIKGASFAGLNVEEFSLQKKQSGIVLVTLNPGENTSGEYGIVVGALSSAGNLRKEVVIDVKVEKCNAMDMQLQQEYDRVCGGEKKKYAGEIINLGTEKIGVGLAAKKPVWADVDRNDFLISPRLKEEFEIGIDVPDSEQGTFYISLSSVINSLPSIKSEKTLKIDAVPKYDCYKAEVISDDRIKNYFSASYIPIKIKNIGIRKAEYEVGIEGSDWMAIEPSKLIVNPGQRGNVNLILSPVSTVSEGAYPVRINVRLDDITYSRAIEIILSKDRMNGIWHFLVFYEAYIYLIFVLIAVLLLFSPKIRKSYRNYRLRKARLNALEKARNSIIK